MPDFDTTINEDFSATLAGTRVFIAPDLPAEYTEAAFTAIDATYVEIGGISDLPGEGGSTFNDVTYSLVAQSYVIHEKGLQDEAELSFTYIPGHTSDAAQSLIREAHQAKRSYAFKVVYPDGQSDYYLAKIYSHTSEGGDGDTVRMRTVTFRRDYRGAITVEAAEVTP